MTLEPQRQELVSAVLQGGQAPGMVGEGGPRGSTHALGVLIEYCNAEPGVWSGGGKGKVTPGEERDSRTTLRCHKGENGGGCIAAKWRKRACTGFSIRRQRPPI